MATWVGCHIRAFAYFGGVKELVVPDNLKAGVTRAHRYAPDTNPTYADVARHYGFSILPARPRRLRDNAKAEVGVLLAERWILAALRHRHFTSLCEVSEAVRPLLEKLNERPMRKPGKSRRELFEEVETRALKPLPSRPYELAFWQKARVNIDNHGELEGQWYSVPYGLVGKEVELRHTEACVEVFLAGRRVASHVSSQQRGRFITQAEHMPASHWQHAEWTPSRVVQWARSVGPACAQLVEELMKRRPHPQQGFRSALGIIRLADKRSTVRSAWRRRAHARCATAPTATSPWLPSSSTASDADEAREQKGSLPEHQNVRGANYYH
jgi:transposase